MLRSHLDWAKVTHGVDLTSIREGLSAESKRELAIPPLATAWYRFATLIELDRTIALRFVPGKPEQVIRDLGRYSASINLKTTYRAFNREDVHEFFRNSALLHRQFQDFGEAHYEKLTGRSGAMRYTGYDSYSPVYCESALGFFEEAIHIQGQASAAVKETSCVCHGAASCVFEMSWERSSAAWDATSASPSNSRNHPFVDRRARIVGTSTIPLT